MAGETVVEQYTSIALQLIQEASEYAGSGKNDPATDANIRQLRTLTISLNAALMSVNIPMMPPAATP